VARIFFLGRWGFLLPSPGLPSLKDLFFTHRQPCFPPSSIKVRPGGTTDVKGLFTSMSLALVLKVSPLPRQPLPPPCRFFFASAPTCLTPIAGLLCLPNWPQLQLLSWPRAATMAFSLRLFPRFVTLFFNYFQNGKGLQSATLLLSIWVEPPFFFFPFSHSSLDHRSRLPPLFRIYP